VRCGGATVRSSDVWHYTVDGVGKTSKSTRGFTRAMTETHKHWVVFVGIRSRSIAWGEGVEDNGFVCIDGVLHVSHVLDVGT
jgi:hypothetical protein